MGIISTRCRPWSHCWAFQLACLSVPSSSTSWTVPSSSAVTPQSEPRVPAGVCGAVLPLCTHTTHKRHIIRMCRRHAAPTQAQVHLHWTAWRSNLPPVNSRRSRFSCCWCKGVERPAKRWHQLRRWRCSRTGSRRTCSAYETVWLWMTLSFPSNSISSSTVVLATVLTI